MGNASLADRIGGEAGCRALVEAFYQEVETEPELRRLYPAHLRCPREGLIAFLVRLTGGETSWRKFRMIPFHQKFRIDVPMRDSWLRCMERAVSATVPAEDREPIMQLFREAATQLVNTGPAPESRYGRFPCPESAGDWERSWSRHQASETAYGAIDTEDIDTLSKASPMSEASLEELLNHAAQQGSLQSMRWLAEAGADARLVPVSGAMLVDHPEAGGLLIKLGGSVSAVEGGEPPIIRAARGDKGEHPERVQALLAAGAPVNEQNQAGQTALHYAARAGHLRTAQLLLDGGADPTIPDNRGQTPLDHAIARGKTEVVDLLNRRL